MGYPDTKVSFIKAMSSLSVSFVSSYVLAPSGERVEARAFKNNFNFSTLNDDIALIMTP